MKNIFNKKNLIDLLLAVLFLVLLFVGYYVCYFLIWVAFVPVILLMHRNNFLPFLFYALLIVCLAARLITFFIKDFNNDYFLLAMAIYAAILLVFFLVCYFLYRKIKFPFSVLVFPLVWLLVMYLGGLIKGMHYFFNLAPLQPTLFPLTWLAGAAGINFLIMLVNSLIAFYILQKNKKVLAYLVAVLLIISACFIYSNTAEPTGRKIKVAIIQGNFSQEWLWRIDNSTTEILNAYESLSLEAAKEKPDIIIWPEYAIPEDISLNKELFGRIANIASATNANLVFGAVAKTEQTDPEYNNIKNVSHVFARDGSYAGGYVSVLPFSFEGVIVPGEELNVINTDVGRIGISACWEETFTFLDKRLVERGADIIINLSNDESIKSLKGMKAKSMFSQISASENKVYVIRATNTGFTEIINSYGKIIAELEPRKEGILISEIYIN